MTSSRLLPIPFALLAVVVAACTFATTPKGEPIAWHLAGMGGANSSGGHRFDASQAEGMTTVPVHVEQWPAEFKDDSWLAQSVAYSPTAVTITLRVSDAYHQRVRPTVGWYDTGGWVDVHLSEPLRNRTLIDGATGKANEYQVPPAP